MNLFDALRAAFPANLDTPAVEMWEGLGATHHVTWRELDGLSARMAHLLAALGLPAGSRIVVQVEKSVQALALYLATLRAGCIFVPLNTAYQGAEMEYFIANAQPAVVVCAPGHFGWLSKIAFKAGVEYVFTLGQAQDGSLLERTAHQSEVHQSVARAPEDVAAILYTSGTTGRSKGAMLTHGNLLSNARTLQAYWGWQEGDVLIHALPIFHVHGLFVALHAALLGASTLRWLSKFEPRSAIAAMAGATVFMGVPTLYVRMLGEPSLTREAVQGMRLFISGSAPLLLDTFLQWQERTGHTILERYGMSETIMLTSNPYHPDMRYGAQAERRGGTVGFPLPGVGVRIVDEAGAACAPGQIGHIQVRGPNVFAGYWCMPEKTAQEFTADGWFKTGDVGLQDERGYVSIVGRNKDLIISGGFNVYPAEIESVLNTLPGVQESAVVGVPHADFGEVGVAVIVPKAGEQVQEQAVLAALKGQLANFKIPKRCFVVPELPRNTMGKVQKNLLRAHYEGA